MFILVVVVDRRERKSRPQTTAMTAAFRTVDYHHAGLGVQVIAVVLGLPTVVAAIDAVLNAFPYSFAETTCASPCWKDIAAVAG